MDLSTLPQHKPAPKFKAGDKVMTPYKGMMMVEFHSGYLLVKDAWVPEYVLVPLNKKGLPDKRCLNSQINRMINRVTETNLKEVA